MKYSVEDRRALGIKGDIDVFCLQTVSFVKVIESRW